MHTPRTIEHISVLFVCRRSCVRVGWVCACVLSVYVCAVLCWAKKAPIVICSSR